MSMVVARMQKMKAENLGGLEIHNERKTSKHSNPDIDITKSNLNYELTDRNKKESYQKQITKFINQHKVSKRATRKDAVLVDEWIITSDRYFFDDLSEDETRHYFETARDFFGDKFGLENIAYGAVHLDENTPHMHMGIVPMKEGRLTSKEVFSRQALLEVQEELPAYLKNHGFSIDRGQKNSEAKNLSVADFKKKIAENEIHELLDEFQVDRYEFDLKNEYDDRGTVVDFLPVEKELSIEQRTQNLSKIMLKVQKNLTKSRLENDKLASKRLELENEISIQQEALKRLEDEKKHTKANLINLSEQFTNTIKAIIDPLGVKTREDEPVYFYDATDKPLFLGTVKETIAGIKNNSAEFLEKLKGKANHAFELVTKNLAQRLEQYLDKTLDKKGFANEISNDSFKIQQNSEQANANSDELRQKIFISPTRSDMKVAYYGKGLLEDQKELLRDFTKPNQIQEIAEYTLQHTTSRGRSR